MQQPDKSNPPIGHKTIIADVNGNRLYRIEGGNWNGDFWFELADGECGFIDTSYTLADEPALTADFITDYSA